MVGTKRQILSTRTAAPELCLGHHLDTAAPKIGKSLIYLALPREARELSKLNSLHKGLGLEPVIGFQGVSAAAPKPIGPLL